MKSFLNKVAQLFSRLLSRDLWSKIFAGIEAASPYLETVYQVVQVAAAMTPTRSDDELIALAEHFGVPAIWRSPDKGEAIREIVRAEIKRRLPDLPDSVINRAIELAVGALK